MIQATSIYNYIFIVHALKGYEFHEARFHNSFAQQQLPFEFVTDGDPSLMTDEIRDSYFVKNIHSILSPGVLSCTLNHFYSYKKMVERQLDYAIVFENDPFFLSHFKEGIQSLENEIKQLPKGFILSLENSTLRFPSYWQTKKINISTKQNLVGWLALISSIWKLQNRSCHTLIRIVAVRSSIGFTTR